MRAAQPPAYALLPENDFEDCSERAWCTEALQTASALAASHAAGLILAAGTSGMRRSRCEPCCAVMPPPASPAHRRAPYVPQKSSLPSGPTYMQQLTL